MQQKEQIARHFISELVVFSTGAEIQFADRDEIETILEQARNNDFLMRYIYVPSEDNPADGPSRGKCYKKRQKENKNFPTHPASVVTLDDCARMEENFCLTYGLSVDEALQF